jgi:YD repeat-containing protein
VDTSQTSDFANKPTGWSTPGGGGLHLIATSVTDDQGRTTKSTDANGNSTYMVYDDANHTTMVFPAWNAATHTTTGSIQVMREDRAHKYSESLTTSLAASYNGSNEPTGLSSSLSASNILSLSRTILNDAGQAIAQEDYVNLPGVTYSTSTVSLGAQDTNYYRTETDYDDRGRLKRVKNAVGTITRYLYDARGHQTEAWVGTDDTGATNGDPDGSGSPNNMLKVSESEYDRSANGGDGNLTSSTVHPNDGSSDRITLYAYDWRNRLIATKSGVTGGTEYSSDNTHPVSFTTYDNLGEQLASTSYDGDEQDIYASGDSLGFAGDPPDDSLRRAYSESSFDELGRAIESRTYSVDPASGDLSTYFLYSDTWFDDRGNLIKTLSPGGLVSKTLYDSLGRASKNYSTDGGGDPAPGASGNWAAADDVSGDKVLEQSAYTYDANGNVILTTTRQRFHDATDTGELGDPSSSSGTAKARVYYSAAYYDAGDRIAESVDFGTFGGSAYGRPVAGPTVANANLETPDEGSGTYGAFAYNPTGGSWTFSGASGLAGDGSGFTDGNPNAPQGDQVAFMQGTGSFSQSVTFAAGTYRIQFKAAQRQNYQAAQQDFQVRIDGNVVGAFTPASTSYGSYQTGAFDVAASSHTIQFIALNTAGGDNTAFVDDLSVVPAMPDRSETALVTSYAYDSAGRVDQVTDPRGIVSATTYDMLSRATSTTAAYVNGTPSDADDQITRYTYDGNGNVLTMTADMPSGTNDQVTQYVYGVDAGDGNGITSNDLLKEVRYPDKSAGTAGTAASDKQQYLYSALGQPIQMTDQNGSVHQYSYDSLGRQTADAVTTLGSGVDDAVVRLETAYNDQGLPYLFTSYDAASSGSVVNEVQREFNGLGQITTEYQEHSGAVNTSTSPKVEDAYSEMASGANHSRLKSMTYPNGRVLHYVYSSGIDSDISRLSYMADDNGSGGVATHLEEYSYLGLGTIVRAARPEPGTELTYIKRSGEGDGDAGDKYIGLDRFSRVVDQRWMTTSSGTALDRFQYGYDRDGNSLYKDNRVEDSVSELYHANSAYDKLNRLTEFRRGTLSSSGNNGSDLDTVDSGDLSALGNVTRVWTLDALGNPLSTETDGTPEPNAFNSRNQFTTAYLGPVGYDNNGNLVGTEHEDTLGYDAWNRLVSDTFFAATEGVTRQAVQSYDAGGGEGGQESFGTIARHWVRTKRRVRTKGP